MDKEGFELKRQRLFSLLKLHSFQERKVTLKSGKESNFYVDCRRTALLAEGHFLIGWLFNYVLREQYPDVEAVGGVTMGADPLASATSLMSYFSHQPLGAFYIRKDAKGHGMGKWMESAAAIREGAPVAVLEDVITTGGSTIRAVERAREHGFDVKCVLALVDRQEEGGAQAVAGQAPLYAFFTREEFFAGMDK